MINVFTMFSGGLAAVEFALKYENIDHNIIGAAEFDKYARQQYLKFHHRPTEMFYEDVRNIDGRKYRGKIDLLVYGSPCQDLSLAGKRKGFDGAKSSLFREGARVQKEMMPKNFIFENVKGLLSSNGGRDYKEVCKTFRDMGYHIHITVMNTKDFGVPQNRERVFIIGFLDEKEYHSYKEPKAFKLETRLRDILEDEVDEKYFLSQKMIDGFMRHKERHQEKGTGFQYKPTDINGYANCLRANAAICPTDNTIDLKQIGNVDTKGHNSLWGRVYSPDGLGACLNANGGGAGAKTGLYEIKSATKKGYEVATEEDSINFTHPDSKTRRGRVGKNVAQTLDCACNQGVIEKSNIRKLTPKECYRLQGIHDKDIDLVVSDTQAYKIAGNAMSVNVMQELLKSLYKQEKQLVSLFDFLGDKHE